MVTIVLNLKHVVNVEVYNSCFFTFLYLPSAINKGNFSFNFPGWIFKIVVLDIIRIRNPDREN